MDLRQRRKLETTRLIHETAVQLARQGGVDGVTVEAICAAAGISQRTFFNYFPFKEAVFVFPPPPLPLQAQAQFLAAQGELLADLIDLLEAQAVEMSGTRWVGPLMREISQAYPRLMPLQMAEFEKFEAELKRLVAQRLHAETDDPRVLALAGFAIGTSRIVLQRWMDDPAADVPARLREALESLVRMIRGSP